jgi:hypothetical protein
MPDALPSSFDREVLDRLPLAEAVLTLGAYLWPEGQLEDFYQAHRADSYSRLISFPTFVGLIGDALLRHDGSLAAAIDRHAERAVLPASRQASYAKLRRVPPSLSVAWLGESTRRLAPIRPATPAAGLPRSLDGIEVLVVDGKALKRVPKRLLSSRGAPGKLSGGKLLGCWDPRTGLVVALAAGRDGEANECTLLEDLLGQIRAMPGPGRRLWVADRQYGDLVQTGRFAAFGDAFLVRRNAKTGFTPDPTRPERVGRDPAGRTIREAWGTLGAGPTARPVRQVTLERPGDPVVLITNLVDAAAYPAGDLLALYLQRWGIERVYQRVVEVFGLARFIGSTPEATISQAAYCLVLSNLIEVVRAVSAACVPEVVGVGSVSAAKLFEGVQEDLVALHRLVTPERVAALVPRPGRLEAVRRRLEELLRGAWRERYRKAAPARGRPHPNQAKGSGAHTSVFRLQEKHQQRQPSRQ